MDNNGKYNGSGNGHDPDEDDNRNVVRIPTLAERDKMRREEEARLRKQYRAENPAEPMINLPPVTKWLLVIFLAIHILTDVIIDPVQQYWVFTHFGFTPGLYTGSVPFNFLAAIAGPLTYPFIHGNWIHLGMNGVMLMAFGTGVEKWMGGKRMLVFFMLCCLLSALAHMAFNPFSAGPVVGASGGLSGFFAAVLIMLHEQGRMGNNKYGIWPFIIFWVFVSFLFGQMGAPDAENSPVAWAAHIGGFLAGFALLRTPLGRF